MNIRNFFLASCLFVLSISANAAIVDNGTYTTDTVSGLDWLDLTETRGLSYDYISSKSGVGQDFEGWRYATGIEVSGFFDAFGGNSAFYNGTSTQNYGLFEQIGPLWGDLACQDLGCTPGKGGSHFMYDLYQYSDTIWLLSQGVIASDATTGIADLSIGPVHTNFTSSFLAGSALVRTTQPVPVPATVWLFGSGLVGLVGLARRKKA